LWEVFQLLLFWVHFRHLVLLGENPIDLYKCLGLGLGDHQEDVGSGEETNDGKNDEAVGAEAKLWDEAPTSEAMWTGVCSRRLLPLGLGIWVTSGPGCTHLNERKDQAHGEVGEPVDTATHHEGGWPGGLQEDLSDEQSGDGT
jgi:hypothetical protein